MMKRLLVLVVAIGLSLAAAHYRFGDSAHAIGLITRDGGKVRHPIHLPAGEDSYTLILTATVIPPWRGSARVVVEGSPKLGVSLHPSRLALNLGLRRLPRFEDGVYHDLRPGDRLALWVRLLPGRGERAEGRYSVNFYDAERHDPVLEVPVILGDRAEGSHGH
jgi:hypothetical protein